MSADSRLRGEASVAGKPPQDNGPGEPHGKEGLACRTTLTRHPGAGYLPAGSVPRSPALMAEPFGPGELLDETLAAVLGPADAATGDAIAGICNDALAAVLGPAVVGALLADRRLLPRVAPWVLDLARGLQYQSRHGSPEPRTISLLARLGGPGIPAAEAVRLAETVDLAAVLAQGRVLEQVLGPGAGARDPRANEAAAPWLAGLKLGSRIHLVQELLRLLDPGTGGRR